MVGSDASGEAALYLAEETSSTMHVRAALVL